MRFAGVGPVAPRGAAGGGRRGGDTAGTVLSDGLRASGSLGAQVVTGPLHLVAEGTRLTEDVRLPAALVARVQQGF